VIREDVMIGNKLEILRIDQELVRDNIFAFSSPMATLP
jgi:hypothetical protein